MIEKNASTRTDPFSLGAKGKEEGGEKGVQNRGHRTTVLSKGTEKKAYV